MVLLFGPYRWHVLALVVMVLGSAALSLFPLRLLGTMADKVVAGDLGALDLLFGAYVAMVVSGALLGVLQGYVNQIVGQGVMQRLRSRLHDHLQRLPMRFYTRTRTGEILARVTSDVNGIQRTLTDTFTDFMTNASVLTIAFVLMFALSWQPRADRADRGAALVIPHNAHGTAAAAALRLVARGERQDGRPSGGNVVRLWIDVGQILRAAIVRG